MIGVMSRTIAATCRTTTAAHRRWRILLQRILRTGHRISHRTRQVTAATLPVTPAMPLATAATRRATRAMRWCTTIVHLRLGRTTPPEAGPGAAEGRAEAGQGAAEDSAD